MSRLFQLALLYCILQCQGQGEVNTTTSASTTKVEETISDANGVIRDNSTMVPSTNSTKVQMTASLFLQMAAEYSSYRMGYALNTYMLPVVIMLGVVGNVLSLLIMQQKQNKKHPLCIYMFGLAINDLCMLIGLGTYSWVHHEIIKRPLAQEECKSGVYFFSVFSINGVLIIMVMTVERFVAIHHPLQAIVAMSSKRAYLVLLVLAMFSFVFCVPQWIYTRTLLNNLCAAFAYTDTFSTVYSWVYLTLNSFLPFSIILILNIFIIKALRRSKHFRLGPVSKEKKSDSFSDIKTSSVSGSVSHVNMEVSTQTELSLSTCGFKDLDDNFKNANSTNNANNVNNANNANSTNNANTVNIISQNGSMQKNEALLNREHQLTAMLVSVSLALLVLTCPQCIRYVMTNLFSFNQSPRIFADFILFYNVTNKIFFINNAINFYLYCLSGTRFRTDLKKLFTCKDETKARN